MPARKHAIVIYAQKKKSLAFLDSFFRDRGKIYTCRFIDDEEMLTDHLARNAAAVIIAEDDLLPAVAGCAAKAPVLCLFTGDYGKGLRSAMSYYIKSYLPAPYLDQELEYRLESLIIENDTMEKMNFHIRELETITEVCKYVSTTLDPKELLYRIVKKISDIIPVTRCSIIRVDWTHQNAFVVASYEDPAMRILKINLRKYPEITRALTSKNPVIIRDVMTNPLMQRVRDIIAPLGIRSILVMPIILHEKVIGTLFLRTSRAGHTFREHEVGLLNAVAHASAAALYNALLFEQVEDEKARLEKLAIMDFLTEIYNIRYFSHRIIEEFSRSERYQFPISCMMIDIDHFKQINDAYGHKLGDQVLKEFARQLKKCCRKSDVVARYGGEEFIVMLPQTALEGALNEGERIRTYFRNYRFRCLKQKKALTISIGVSSYPHPRVRTHDDLISFADNGLYLAKSRGRDRVVVFEG